MSDPFDGAIVSAVLAVTCLMTGPLNLMVLISSYMEGTVGSLPSIDGGPATLRSFEGKILLVVNVASKCGGRRSRGAVEALHE